MKKNGFGLIENLGLIAVLAGAAFILALVFLNNRGYTEERAYQFAKSFVEQNQLDVARMTCAGDSNNDGYGSCAVTLKNDERIMLQCPTDFFAVRVFGASSCKEVFNDTQFRMNAGG